MRTARLLYWAAAAAALFACVDFYFQFPAPAGYGPQFVWLDSGVYRRAQGLFYEASTLGNFCAFFLVMIAVAFTRPRAESPVSRKALLAGGAVFFAALVLSFSRASLLNVAVALAVLMWCNRRRVRLARVALLAAAGALLTWWIFPVFAQMYWLRLSITAEYLFTRTEGVLSGRVASWHTLVDWIAANPWQALFGIGYKTLPYTNFLGNPVVADNMYLSLLVETGVVGLAALVWLNVAILRAAARRAQRLLRHVDAVFLGRPDGTDGVRRPADLLACPAGVFLDSGAGPPRMNLLFLDQFSDLGGAQKNLLELLPAVRAEGWHALVGLPGEGELFQRVRALGFEAERIDCGPYGSGRKSAADLGRFLAGTPQLAAQMRRLAQRVDADLVYLNGPRLLPAAALAGFGRPVLFHSHSYLGPGAVRRLAGIALRRLDAWLVGQCEFVAAPWRPFVRPDRVSVIFNGVTGPPHASPRAPTAAPRVGCIGRIAPEKGQREFVAAAKQIHQRASAAAASRSTERPSSPTPPPHATRRRCAPTPQGLPLEFAGWVDDIYACLAQLDLLLVPSSGHEATTRVILEAFAAGVPVIAFPSGGIPEVIEDGSHRPTRNHPRGDGANAPSTSSPATPAACTPIAQAAHNTWKQRFTLERYHHQILQAIEAARGAGRCSKLRLAMSP